MRDEAKTGDQLIIELNEMRRKVGELESRLRQATEPSAQWGIEHETYHDEIEKRTRLEKGLGDTERLYRTLVETAKDVIWTVDLNLRYTYVSPSVTEALGYTVQEIMALQPLDGLTADSREKIIKAFQEELASEASGPREKYTSRTEEIERYHKNGSTRWEQITTTFLRDGQGKPIGILGISHDITDRKRMEDELRGARDDLEQRVEKRTGELARVNARLHEEVRERKQVEDALRDSQQRLELALNGADLGLWDWYIQRDHAVINERSVEIVGYQLDEVDTRFGFWENLVHPEDKLRAVETVYAHLEGRTDQYEDEYRVKTKSGEWKWISSRGKVVERDRDGKPIRMVGTYRDITHRKKSEEALRESENRYRQVTECSLTGIFIHQDGVAVYVNQRLADILGYSNDEMTGGHFLDAVHPDDREMVAERARARLNGELSASAYQLRLLRKTGEVIWCEVLATLINYRGRPALMGNVADITNRKKGEEELREAKDRYRRLFDNAPLMYVITRNEHGVPFISDCNELFLNSAGYLREEVLGKPLANFYSPNSTTDLLGGGGYARALAGEFLIGERQLLTRDGRLVPTLLYTTTEEDTTGQVIGTRAMFVDITEQKRAEDALAKQLALMTELMEAIPLPIFFKNVDHVYVGCNTAFAQFVGLPKERIVGKPVFDVVSRETAKIFRQHDEELFNHPGTQVYSTSVKRSDGSTSEVIFHKATYNNPDGQVSGLIGAILDITERKLLEQQLLQAQKMQAIGTLTGGIAHEFNNLLTVISGFAELLLTQKKENDPESVDLQRIMTAAHKGAELVASLLTISRKSQTNLVHLDLNHEVTQVKKLLDGTLPKAIEIELELSDGLRTVRADAGQIRQLIMNLALNARDAMPEGGKLKLKTNNIDLCADQETAPAIPKSGAYVQLIVSDTGIGMERETLEHIFEPFYSTKGLAYKTGLGLAVVHGIVEQHGGLIACESEPGQGAAFKICFPASEPEESESVSHETQSEARTETILLVDDEEHVRDLTARLLGREGYRVIAAEDGLRAVELYGKEKNNISLVILDLIMPKMGGTQCLRELLKIDPKTKVIIATGYSDASNRDEFIGAGAKGFVGKPFQAAHLLKIVRNVLDIV